MDIIFPSVDGGMISNGNRVDKLVENFGKTFKKILTDTNLLFDGEGQ
jgi:hypothetical protein